eukprot:5817807-Pleurochrysis_carterae.AAC.1
MAQRRQTLSIAREGRGRGSGRRCKRMPRYGLPYSDATYNGHVWWALGEGEKGRVRLPLLALRRPSVN